jgi:extracellular factor (EF) 3-hydroxypalmitic acid methyl ester biosynthesis protein
MMSIESEDPALGSHRSNQGGVLATLHERVGDFLELEAEETFSGLYHRVLAAVYALCASIVACEEEGLTRAAIVDVLEPVRRIHARSPFVRRLQEWPRGYPGDFEIVEYLCRGRRRTEEETLAQVCESYALTRSIAQQHRNKVQHQAARILRTLMERPGTARVFSIACGSCPDLRQVSAHLPRLLGELWLNDSDPDALDFSMQALAPVAGRCRLQQGNVFEVVRTAKQEKQRFDLVLAGGLFDYLSQKAAVRLIHHAWSLLAAGGVFFFTNIATGNPYRPLIEYFGDWFLIERSETEILRDCEAAGIPAEAVSIAREETGLALLIEVRKEG